VLESKGLWRDLNIAAEIHKRWKTADQCGEHLPVISAEKIETMIQSLQIAQETHHNNR